MAIDPDPLVWADDFAGGTPTSAANLNRITAEVSSEVNERIAVQAATDTATYAPVNLTGTYAARPAANTVPVGSVYYCTNIPESYRSDGSAWSVLPSGGTELAYATRATDFVTTSTTAVDIDGLTTTFIVGERPVILHFGGVVKNSLSGAYSLVLLVLDGTQVGAAGGPLGANDAFEAKERSVRISGLTPGSTHTFKARTASFIGGGTTTVSSAATNPMAIWVATT